MNRKQRKKREALRARKREIYIKLGGLTRELNEWDSSMMSRVTATKRGTRIPIHIAKEIGELEAERDLINVDLVVMRCYP